MDTLQIRKYWIDNGEMMYTYAASQLKNSRLLKETIAHLIECGLPDSCAPFLSFDDCKEIEIQTPNQVLCIDFEELNDFLMIGSNGSGDPICIDLNKGNEIVFLNHDNFFERIFINSDINKLLNCLIFYRNFISLINASDDSNFINARFNDLDFFKLKQDLYNIDNKCLEENTMWRWELDGLLAERSNS